MSAAQVYDMTPEDLGERLVGHSISSSDEQSMTLTLDNGTVLQFSDVSDCCAWFRVESVSVSKFGSIVTKVERADYERGDGDGFTINVLSASEVIGAVEIDGDATNGYYCHSITLNVTEAKS